MMSFQKTIQRGGGRGIIEDKSDLTSRNLLKKPVTLIQKNLSTPMFIAMSFTIAKKDMAAAEVPVSR